MAEVIDLDRVRKAQSRPRVRKQAETIEVLEVVLVFTPDFDLDDLPSDTEPDEAS